MVRDLTNQDKMKINVALVDGTEFTGCDITSQPFGDGMQCVAFWSGTVVRMYPMAQVKAIVLYEED